jgi:ribonuclease HI
VPYTKFPPTRPRGSHRGWETALQLPTRLELYTHGLVERQIATCGFLVWDVGENRLLIRHGKQVAEGKHITKELADHRALIEGLKWLIHQEYHRKRVLAFTDNRQVIDHLSPALPVFASGLSDVVHELQRTLDRFSQLQLDLVPIHENLDAAEQASAAYVSVQEERRRQRSAKVQSELYQIRPGHYWVGNRYQVDLEAGTCTCPDFRQIHSDEYPIRCKHLLAADALNRQVKE